MPHLEKFSENAMWASSSQNQRWEGVGSENEDVPKQRGFRDGVDLPFGAIDATNENKKKGRDRETIRKVLKQFKYNNYIEK